MGGGWGRGGRGGEGEEEADTENLEGAATQAGGYIRHHSTMSNYTTLTRTLAGFRSRWTTGGLDLCINTSA